MKIKSLFYCLLCCSAVFVQCKSRRARVERFFPAESKKTRKIKAGDVFLYYAKKEGLKVIEGMCEELNNISLNYRCTWYEGDQCSKYAEGDLKYMFLEAPTAYGIREVPVAREIREKVAEPGDLKSCIIGKDSDGEEMKDLAINQNGRKSDACDSGFTGCWVIRSSGWIHTD